MGRSVFRLDQVQARPDHSGGEGPCSRKPNPTRPHSGLALVAPRDAQGPVFVLVIAAEKE